MNLTIYSLAIGLFPPAPPCCTWSPIHFVNRLRFRFQALGMYRRLNRPTIGRVAHPSHLNYAMHVLRTNAMRLTWSYFVGSEPGSRNSRSIDWKYYTAWILAVNKAPIGSCECFRIRIRRCAYVGQGAHVRIFLVSSCSALEQWILPILAFRHCYQPHLRNAKKTRNIATKCRDRHNCTSKLPASIVISSSSSSMSWCLYRSNLLPAFLAFLNTAPPIFFNLI